MSTELKLLTDYPLRSHHTFATEVSCDYCVMIDNESQIDQLRQLTIWSSTQHVILGEGSNTLFAENYPGLIIINQIPGINVTQEDETFVWLKIGAGVNWHALVCYGIDHNYGGIENLSLIPGTVGAAPIQNIGAYGVELESVFVELSAVDLASGEKMTFSHHDCEFSYRNSIFKSRQLNSILITDVTLRLTKQDHQYHIEYGQIQQVLDENDISTLSLKSISDAVIQIRQNKLPNPNTLPNAGSFFKNPIIITEQLMALQHDYPEMPFYDLPAGEAKIPAAWLIEQCGFKGQRQGHTGVHEQQALVLVNYDNAKGQDILELANTIQTAVEQKFDIKLMPEVTII